MEVFLTKEEASDGVPGGLSSGGQVGEGRQRLEAEPS